MKKILIVMSNMGIGGAEKSLLSFLKALTAGDVQYRVELMVVNPHGEFYSQIPEAITQIEPCKELRWLGNGFQKELLTKYFSFRSLWGELRWIAKKKRYPKQWNAQQKLWDCWKNSIPPLAGEYDAAISYIDGFTNYYVMEKVRAKKKILWVHSEYQKRKYDPAYDRKFFEVAQGIVTISEQCRQCILQEFPQCEEKTFVLENITIPRDVIEKSAEGDCPEFFGKLKLLTVARLNPLKGVDIAVDAAKLLQETGLDFCWLVVGDGPEKNRLQEQIAKCGLQERFLLLGSRENPYPYMKQCDILVQPSRVEGKSIVLDEAMILEKPIVATNYTSVVDSLTHGVTGWIVDMTPEAVARGIAHLWQNPQLCQKLQENLQALPKEDTALLDRYVKIMF